jgi:hypothetical protein
MLSDSTSRCYNASSTAATPLESLRYLQQQKPDAVYLGLDLYTIIEEPLINESFVDDRLRISRQGEHNFRFYQQWITDHFGALLSWQVLDHSRLTFRSQGKTMFMPTSDGMPFIRPDGSWGDDPTRLMARGNDARGRSQEKRYLHIYRVMSLLFQRSLEQHPDPSRPVNATIDAHLEAFRDIVVYCQENDIRLTLFFNAAHAYYWQLAYREMGRSVLDYWKRRVLNINHSVATQYGRKPYPLHDFSGINEISIQEIPAADNGHQFADRFQDPMHYSPKIGRRMLALMARGCNLDGDDGWGRCLGEGNIDLHLLDQWRRYAAFTRQNGGDVARFRRRAMAQASPGS